MTFQISEVFVFVVPGDDGDDGVPAMFDGRGWLPLIAADSDRFALLKRIAQKMVEDGASPPMKIIRLSNREEIGSITRGGRSS